MDEAPPVRSAMAERKDFTPTPEQVERGLTNVDWMVRKVCADRIDFIPTPEQIERGLADSNKDVQEAWKNRVKEPNSNALKDDFGFDKEEQTWH